MKILPTNNLVSSLLSNVNEKITESLTPIQKLVGVIALVVFSCLALAFCFSRKLCCFRDKMTTLLGEDKLSTPWVEDKTLNEDVALTAEQKKTIIKSLPTWLESHFPTTIPGFKRAYADLYIECEDKSDDEINNIFETLQTKIIDSFSSQYDKTSIMLRGLQLPKDDNPQLVLVIRKMLHKIWNNILMGQADKSYAECNRGIMSFDAHAILEYEFKKNKAQLSEKNRVFWESELRNSECFESLNMAISRGPVFTIGVSKP